MFFAVWHSDFMNLNYKTNFRARRTIMVDSQVRPANVTHSGILDAMLALPRERFVPEGQKNQAYIDDNLALDTGDLDTKDMENTGRFMLSPRSFSKMLNAVNPQNSDVVLDIGCALGYSTAVLAHVCASVIGVESSSTLVAAAETNLEHSAIDNAIIHKGDLALGASAHAPYDLIVIEGAVQCIPNTIAQQIATGGRIVCLFAESALGVCRIGYKTGNSINWQFVFNATAPILSGFERERPFVF